MRLHKKVIKFIEQSFIICSAVLEWEAVSCCANNTMILPINNAMIPLNPVPIIAFIDIREWKYEEKCSNINFAIFHEIGQCLCSVRIKS